MREDFEKFLKENGYQGAVKNNLVHCGGYEEPCYVTRFKVRGGLDSANKIHKTIFYAARDSKRGILLLSVTERDAYHKLWLEEVKKYEGVTITECLSRWHGNYKCWMICIPLH